MPQGSVLGLIVFVQYFFSKRQLYFLRRIFLLDLCCFDHMPLEILKQLENPVCGP